jgi:hypothetical protein
VVLVVLLGLIVGSGSGCFTYHVWKVVPDAPRKGERESPFTFLGYAALVLTPVTLVADLVTLPFQLAWGIPPFDGGGDGARRCSDCHASPCRCKSTKKRGRRRGSLARP